MLLGFWLAASPLDARALCPGDCNDDCDVTTDDILTMVSDALAAPDTPSCSAGDANVDGSITVDEIVIAADSALGPPICECLPPRDCGNGSLQTGEECDDSGLCIGGPTAGTPCTRDSQCSGNGICEGGARDGTACSSDTQCADGRCVHCKTFGGDGCAANCTRETDVTFDLMAGAVVGGALQPGTSGVSVHSELFPIFPLPLQGSEVLTIGAERDGRIPVVVKASSVRFPAIPLGAIACGCVRGVALKTCGGTLFEADGSPSPSCSEDFSGAVRCPASRACAFAHGPGNALSGFMSCQTLSPIDVSITQDAGGSLGEPTPPMITLSGVGPAGSLLAFNTIATGTRVGACTPTFCTDADPVAQRGTPFTSILTTGEACCTIVNANGTDDLTIGPVCGQGAPLDCRDLMAPQPTISDLGLVGAYPALGQPSLDDTCITTQLFAAGSASP